MIIKGKNITPRIQLVVIGAVVCALTALFGTVPLNMIATVFVFFGGVSYLVLVLGCNSWWVFDKYEW